MRSKYGLHSVCTFFDHHMQGPCVLSCNWGDHSLVKLALLFSQCNEVYHQERYQDTNKVYNQESLPRYQQNVQPGKIPTKCTTRKTYQDTNKMYNQENLPRYQQSVQPAKPIKIPTKCTNRKTYHVTNKVYNRQIIYVLSWYIPRYRQSVQPAKGTKIPTVYTRKM